MIRRQELKQQYVKTATAKVSWNNAKHRGGMCECFQKKYYVLLGLLYIKYEDSTQLSMRIDSKFARAVAPTSVEKFNGWIYKFT